MAVMTLAMAVTGAIELKRNPRDAEARHVMYRAQHKDEEMVSAVSES